MADASVYSSSHGNTVQGVSINDSRRKFNFGERVAELAPQQSPFFVYLNKVAKKSTDDPVFKFLEQRHQWQRRNFEVDLLWDTGAEVEGTAIAAADGQDLQITCKYDKYGNISTSDNPCYFILPGQIIGVANDDGTVRRFRINPDAAVTTITADYATDDLDAVGVQHCEHANDGFTVVTAETLTPVGAGVGAGEAWAVGNKGQVLGSAFGEGTGAPVGWEDSLYDREGFCQIFKTGMNIFSGTAMATSYRGVNNEWQRVWQEKLMEHKMDIEHAMLFGIGSANQESSPTGAPVRYTHGILPFTETNGKVYSMSYASSGYDAFLDAMEDFFAPESGNSGNKLVLASRKVITYLNKLGGGSFMNNSVGSDQYRLDIESIPGSFGHTVTKVNTIFGNLHFVADPLLRGPWENYCVAVDMANVSYRPLVGNGVSRDTFIETNVQGNDIDGRQDQIITEAGLEVSLPETHAILKFS
tara:strand:- start:7666 stop:9078 length:1413 start_codon:yes stop_codon:yes gene_type:complete